MANSFGKLFKVTTWGESHGPATGVVIDGCPPGLPLSLEDILPALARRRPGQSSLTSPRLEADLPQILSGIEKGHTLGTPISIVIPNQDARPEDYSKNAYRPGHADYTYHTKYGIPQPSGGGRASARETAARVAAGAVAMKLLQKAFGTEISAFVNQVHNIQMPELREIPTLEEIEATPVRCPHKETALEMAALIQSARDEGDSLGGTIRCFVSKLPPGLGEPVFDKLEADLAKACLSLPACKGFEVGSGFHGATTLKGSEHNDSFTTENGKIHTQTNHSGGIQGGISNGEPLNLRLAFKPTSTIAKPQQSVTPDGAPTTLESRGRHDPCVLPRAVVIVEAMVALVLADHALRHHGQCRFLSSTLSQPEGSPLSAAPSFS